MHAFLHDARIFFDHPAAVDFRALGIACAFQVLRLVVRTRAGELLIPFALEICTTIDPKAKRIVVDPPEGLLELNSRVGIRD